MATPACELSVDDLKLIVGVGPKLEKLLNEMGFWHFDQIANWTPEQVAWVNSRLGTFKGRIERDDWIVLSALPSDVLVGPRVDLWSRVLRRQPLPMALMATHPIDVSRN